MSCPHHLEYAKTSKAKCNGAPPCKGSIIPANSLRYGVTVQSDFGEIVRWMHWGCVTPSILGKLAGYGVHRVPHFGVLNAADQAKIRKALAARRVDSADIPATARLPGAPLSPIPALALSQGSSSRHPSKAPGSSQSQTATAPPSLDERKRKATKEATAAAAAGPSTAWAASSYPAQGTSRIMRPSGVTWEEGVHDDDTVEVVQPVEELYTTLKSKIVGVQYYQGLVGVGQQVNLVREPTNRYDRNAIKVTNICNEQVGHCPRDVVSKLAPMIDKGLITAEGIMDEGNLNGMKYSLNLTIKIYGDTNKRALLEPQLMWATNGRGFPKQSTKNTRLGSSSGPSSSQVSSYGGASVGVRGYPTSQHYGGAAGYPPAQTPASTQGYPYASQLSPAEQASRQELRKKQEAFAKAAELRDILNNMEKVNDEGRRHSLLDTLCSTEDVLGLPVHPNPPSKASGELTVNLLKHQSQALQWCIQAENPTLPQREDDKPVQFWQLKKNGGQSYYYNVATKTPQTATPTLGRGALCADSMGLGKTLTMLALIVATKNDNRPDYSKTTLIVVPLSIISNWEKQIKDHCAPNTLKSIVYYDKTRGMSPEELAKYDVVITTYQTVAGEHANSQGVSSNGGAPAKKKKKAINSLFALRWKRIILDEGHNIRNERTKMAQAIFALDGERRWVLTGTPIINSPSDLGSITRFLRVCAPLDNPDYFKRLVLRPLKDGDPAGSEILRAIMAQICIRRTKEMQDSEGKPLVPLPPVDMTLIPVTLHAEARELYDRIEDLSKERIESFMNANGPNAALSNISLTTNALSMLTRLRQLALHPGLIPPDYAEQLMKANEETLDTAIQITPEERLRLQNALAQAIEDNEECPICFDTLDNPRITGCSHRFCLVCITEVLSRDNKCPMDRRTIGMGDLIEPPPPTLLTQAPVRVDDEEQNDLNELRHCSSAKIDQLLRLLELTPSKEKSLVFSQFTSFLDKISEALDEAGIAYVRFDGQMSARRRQEALERFSVPISDNDESSADTTARAPTPEQTFSSGRVSRRQASKLTIEFDDDTAPNGDDSDFNPGLEVDDDDGFIDDEEDENPFTTKGKAKAKKNKEKVKATRFARSTTKASYSPPAGSNPKIMLISLKAGALGLNLTVANNVYLMDPWWQEGIESQAIDRCNRIGQTRPVHVYQLIAENTVESKVIDIQEKKKALVKEAFSGMKNKESQRQKKEARLQEIIELFGIRRAADQAPRPGPRQTTLQFEVEE